jgi:hypothetical protein
MVLAHLRSDAERLYGPHHSLVAEAGHMLERLVRLGG